MKNIFYLLILLTVVSCGSGKNDAMDVSERLELIKELEDKAYADMNQFDTIKALALMNNYGKFADENPDNEMSPNFLFKAGDLSMAMHKPVLAIGFFDRIINNYPDFEKLPYCMFLKGFILEDQLGEMAKAKEAYEAFIEKYPDHEMTDAARFSIKNLGKSPEDLIREFEKKQDTTQAES